MTDSAAGLINLEHASLDELLRRDHDTALDAAIRRITAAAENEPEESVSAFNSAS